MPIELSLQSGLQVQGRKIQEAFTISQGEQPGGVYWIGLSSEAMASMARLTLPGSANPNPTVASG